MNPIACPTSAWLVNDLAARLRGMTRATPELLRERALLVRRDWKFLMTAAEAEQLVHQLRASHAVLHAGDAVLARYETRYFDTTGRRLYDDHRRGRYNRAKVRIRTYRDRQLTMLEVKRKRRGTTHKVRFAAPYRLSSLDDASLAHLDGAGIHGDTLVPALDNVFHRVSLLGLHAAERLTLDFGVAWDVDGARHRLGRTVVVELKSARPPQQSVAWREMRRLGVHPARFSKYCIGTASLVPGVPTQTFAPTLRRLARLEAS